MGQVEKRINLGAGGFSLLEVVIAMSILSIGILGTVGLQYLSVRNNTSGNIASQANMLARSRLEQIKSEGNVNLLNAGRYPNEIGVVPQDGSQNAMPGGGMFNIDFRFCDPLDKIFAGGYTPPAAMPDVCGANFANCGAGTPSCQNNTSGTCLAAVRVSWNRGGGGRAGQGCVVLQTFTQGNGI